VLLGTTGSEGVLREAARGAAEEVETVEDLNGSAAYKKQLIQVYVRRVLMQAVASAGS